MDWCRLSTGYYLDAELLRAGEPAEVLFLRCLAYSGAQESRGRVPKHVLPLLTPTRTKARTSALLDAGLIVEDGHDVVIRSWSRWQESLDTESERRRRDRERKAAERAAARDTVPGQSKDASADESTDSPHSVRPKKPRKEVEVEEEKDLTPPQPSVVAPPRSTRIPDVFPITPAMTAWAAETTPAVQLEPETANWQDWHRAKGDTAKDWTASWRTWMRRAQKDTQRPGQRPLAVIGTNGHRPSASEAAAQAAIDAGERVQARHRETR